MHEVAQERRVDWHGVKAMEMEYVQAQLDVVFPPAPQVIGIEVMSIRKADVHPIVVSDLTRATDLVGWGGSRRGQYSDV